MAGETPNLTVALSSVALRSLDEIWDSNTGRYGVDHADRYVGFLLERTNGLGVDYFKGKPVPAAPKFSYIVMRGRRSGHGHLAVYELMGDTI